MNHIAKLVLLLVHGIGPQNPNLHEDYLEGVEHKIEDVLTSKFGDNTAKQLIGNKLITVRAEWSKLFTKAMCRWLILHLYRSVIWENLPKKAREKAALYGRAYTELNKLAAPLGSNKEKLAEARRWIKQHIKSRGECSWMLRLAREGRDWDRFIHILQDEKSGFEKFADELEGQLSNYVYQRDGAKMSVDDGKKHREIAEWLIGAANNTGDLRRIARLAFEARLGDAAKAVGAKLPGLVDVICGMFTGKFRSFFAVPAFLLILVAVIPAVIHVWQSKTTELWKIFVCFLLYFSLDLVVTILILCIINKLFNGCIVKWLISIFWNKGTIGEALGKLDEFGQHFPWGDLYSFLREFEAFSVSDIFLYQGEVPRTAIYMEVLTELRDKLERADCLSPGQPSEVYAVFAGHSWGTVILYDLLQAISDYSTPGKSAMTQKLEETDVLLAAGPAKIPPGRRGELEKRKDFLELAQLMAGTVEPLGFVTFGCPVSPLLFREGNALGAVPLWEECCSQNFLPSPDQKELVHARVGVPWRWYNFWHPTDFVAHRLEPFFNLSSYCWKFVEDRQTGGKYTHGVEAHSSYWTDETVHQQTAELIADCLEKI